MGCLYRKVAGRYGCVGFGASRFRLESNPSPPQFLLCVVCHLLTVVQNQPFGPGRGSRPSLRKGGPPPPEGSSLGARGRSGPGEAASLVPLGLELGEELGRARAPPRSVRLVGRARRGAFLAGPGRQRPRGEGSPPPASLRPRAASSPRHRRLRGRHPSPGLEGRGDASWQPPAGRAQRGQPAAAAAEPGPPFTAQGQFSLYFVNGHRDAATGWYTDVIAVFLEGCTLAWVPCWEEGHISIEEFVSNNSCHHWIYLSQTCLYKSVTKDHKTMWLNKGLQCTVETGFNYTNWFNFKSREEQQKNLQDFCTITTPFSGSSCENTSSFSAALLGTVSVFLTCGVLLSFVFLIFTIHFRNNRIVKMSSPNLNVVTLLGSVLTYSSAYLFGIEKQNSVTKPSMEMLFQVRLCLLCIGSSLAFGPILGKSWRLYKVFTQQVPDKRVIIKDFQLLVMVSMLVLADIILLLTWILLDPVQCLQGINIDLQVTEKGLTCTMRQGYFCTSLYSDFWLLLFLGFKCSLLICGAYLAGLTDHLSCPPVNQSLTLIIAIALIFLSTGLMLVVNRFFHLWHNLVFGFTSGGILVCTSTINCLIFIPQIRQWKTFEKQKDDASHMAKYFTSSSKNFQSTMYSDEEIYQLLGEKNSMIQQLAEKNTAIACLQEEVNSAKEKLMRLVAVEEYNPVDSPFPSLQLLEAHSAANCSSMVAENQPRDAFSSGQELKTWQYPQLPNSQSRPGLYTKKDCTDYQEHATQQMPFDITARCRLRNDYKKTGVDFCSKDDQDHQLCQYTSTFCMGTFQEPFRLSIPSGEAKEGKSSLVTPDQLPEITHVRSKKLQETLQDLSNNSIAITQMSSRGSEQRAEYDMNIMCQPPETLVDIKNLSPFEIRQEKKCSFPPTSLYTVNKTASRMQTSSINLPATAVSDTKDGSSLHQLPSLSASLQYNAENILYLSSTRNLLQYHQKDFLTHTLQGPLSSKHYYPGSDASSSSSGAYPPHCHHRHCCEFCRFSLSSSSDSYITGIDSELGMAQSSFVKRSDKSQPLVNFNEDLEPTYV